EGCSLSQPGPDSVMDGLPGCPLVADQTLLKMHADIRLSRRRWQPKLPGEGPGLTKELLGGPCANLGQPDQQPGRQRKLEVEPVDIAHPCHSLPAKVMGLKALKPQAGKFQFCLLPEILWGKDGNLVAGSPDLSFDPPGPCLLHIHGPPSFMAVIPADRRAAVSVRRILDPRLAPWRPASFRRAISVWVQPRSGPMARSTSLPGTSFIASSMNKG